MMLTLRRCLTRRLPPVGGRVARAGAAARDITASPHLGDGNLADVCNLNVVSSPFPPVPDVSRFPPVPDFVSSHWKALADKVAIRDGSTGETRTFSEYDDRTNRIASALKSEYNLQPDETVALYSLNNVDYLPICLAVGRCGSKVTPINPLSTAGELSKILSSSGSKVLFTHAKLLPVALEAARSSPCVEHVVVIPYAEADSDLPEGAEHLDNLSAYEGADAVQHPIGDLTKHPWLLPYSSGTTGLPKGCMLSHANLVVNMLQMDAVEKIPQDHKLISPLPFFHIYGMLASLLYCGWRGQELITTSAQFDLAKYCQLVEEHKPQRSHLVPPVSDFVLGLMDSPLVINIDGGHLSLSLD